MTPLPFCGNHVPCQGQGGTALAATLRGPGCYGRCWFPKTLSRVSICCALLREDAQGEERAGVFYLSAKAVSAQRTEAAVSGCVHSSLSHCRDEGEAGAVICAATHVKSRYCRWKSQAETGTQPHHCLMSLSPTPALLLCFRQGRRVALLHAGRVCALGSAFCTGQVGFGEPPEQGKDPLGAGCRVKTGGGSSMEETVG